MGALFKQAGDFVACIILSETFDLLFFPKNKIYLCSFSVYYETHVRMGQMFKIS